MFCHAGAGRHRNSNACAERLRSYRESSWLTLQSSQLRITIDGQNWSDVQGTLSHSHQTISVCDCNDIKVLLSSYCLYSLGCVMQQCNGNSSCWGHTFNSQPFYNKVSECVVTACCISGLRKFDNDLSLWSSLAGHPTVGPVQLSVALHLCFLYKGP